MCIDLLPEMILQDYMKRTPLPQILQKGVYNLHKYSKSISKLLRIYISNAALAFYEL